MALRGLLLSPIAAATLPLTTSGGDVQAQGGQPAKPVRLSGVITDSTGVGIAGAEVQVIGDSAFVTTDGQGVFRLTLRPGSYLIRVRAIGFHSLDQIIQVDSATTSIGRLTLTPAAAPARTLPDVVVEAEPTPVYLTRAIDQGFFRHRRLGFGTFLTKEQIDAYFPLSVGDILRNIPGVRLESGEAGGTRVYFTRCSDAVGVWLNGVRIRAADHNVALALIHPKEIAAIEVYRGIAQIPAEYRQDNCAAILVWTP